MAKTLIHRGPDDYGQFIDHQVGFGHRRLKIIDLECGQQPMRLANGLTIVFNGEIYNFIELRETLRLKGHVFHTKSDTEVLLAAWMEWGEKCLDKLNGMFAFVIYHPADQKLFIARDRLGKKPFYYFHSDGLFAFASELKALLPLPPVRAALRPNSKAFSDFLSLGYILTPKTIFENIWRLPAAHWGTYDLRSGNLSLSKYWRLEEFYGSDAKIPYNQNTAEEFRELFFDACRLRMRSDVPVGGFLSGGLDSTSVVYGMSRLSPIKTKAFSASFSDASYDETPFSVLAARTMNVEQVVLNIDQMQRNILSKVVWHCDEPFADTSVIPTYWLNQRTKEYATVALSGDGADEIFAGYPTYLADRLHHIYGKVPACVHSLLLKVARHTLKPSYKKLSLDYKLIKFLSGHGLSRENAHYWWRTIFNEDEKRQILGADVTKECGDYSPYEAFKKYHADMRGCSFIDQTLYVDQKTWLQDDILVKMDRMSMAGSVEVRSPFLDHRIVELAARLPAKAKMNGMRQKVVLKDAMKPFLPARILNRGKRGFGAPMTYFGKFRVDSRKPSPLISCEYTLDGRNEDITYKSFCFAVLGKWINMYHQFIETGEWGFDSDE